MALSPGRKLSVEDQVNALAGSDHRRGCGLGLAAKRSVKGPVALITTLACGAKFVAGFHVAGDDAIDKSLERLW